MSQEFPAERMQTNAAWAQGFVLNAAEGGPPVDLSGWTIEGRIEILGREDAFLPLDEASGRLVLTPAAGGIAIALTSADCAALGEGLAHIEIMRLAPEPARPLIIATIENHKGLSA